MTLSVWVHCHRLRLNQNRCLQICNLIDQILKYLCGLVCYILHTYRIKIRLSGLSFIWKCHFNSVKWTTSTFQTSDADHHAIKFITMARHPVALFGPVSCDHSQGHIEPYGLVWSNRMASLYPHNTVGTIYHHNASVLASDQCKCLDIIRNEMVPYCT